MARLRPSIGLGILAACASVFLAGCDGAGSSDLTGLFGEGGAGRLTVQITDDPFPHEFVAEAWVTITRIDVLRSSDEEEQEPAPADEEAEEEEEEEEELADPSADEEPDDSDDEESDDLKGSQAAKETDDDEFDDDDQSDADDESGSDDEGDEASVEEEEDEDEEDEDGESHGESRFLTVFQSEEGVEYNLVELRNGRMADLVDAEIPAGSYKLMRIFVSGGWILLTDGREFPLRVPSGDRSGIKLRFNFEIVDGQVSELLLDFDLSRAFRPVPGGAFRHAREIREFIFRPSHAMRMANLGKSGCLSGELTDDAGEPRGHATVTAFRGDQEIAGTVTEEDGSFRFVGLPPGEYRLVFEGADFDPHELIGQMVDVHRCRDHDDRERDEEAQEDDETEDEEPDVDTDDDSSEDD